MRGGQCQTFLCGGWAAHVATLVELLIAYHLLCLRHTRQLAENRSDKSHRYFRNFNEVPVLFLTGIVILVVVKPF